MSVGSKGTLTSDVGPPPGLVFRSLLDMGPSALGLDTMTPES